MSMKSEALRFDFFYLWILEGELSQHILMTYMSSRDTSKRLRKILGKIRMSSWTVFAAFFRRCTCCYSLCILAHFLVELKMTDL